MASKTRRKATKIKLKKLRKTMASLKARPPTQSSLQREKSGLKKENKVLSTISQKVTMMPIWRSDRLPIRTTTEEDLPKLESNWTRRRDSLSVWSNSCSISKKEIQKLTRRRQTGTTLPPKKRVTLSDLRNQLIRRRKSRKI